MARTTTLTPQSKSTRWVERSKQSKSVKREIRNNENANDSHGRIKYHDQIS